MSDDLADRPCIPCRGGVPPLGPDRIEELHRGIPDWRVVEGHRLERIFSFQDFAAALAFTNAIGRVAEEQNHHPEIHLGWGRVRVEVWTHKIDGLTASDFYLAAKFDRALRTPGL